MRYPHLLFLSVAAICAHANTIEPGSIGPLDDVVLFDAPAFRDPAKHANTLVSFQSFVFSRQVDPAPFTTGVVAVFKSFGLDVSDKIPTIQERVRLFAAVGLRGKKVNVDVRGCGKQARLPGTSGPPDMGMVLQNVSVGACGSSGGTKEFVAQVSASRNVRASVFYSPNSGFGVISDIDDTIKVSNVLDKLALAKSTLLDEPKAVTGMPELYASLRRSLNSPQFLYISGSPFQLYPFLDNFIGSAYSASKGPIFLQNLTVVDIQDLLNFANSGDVQAYKVSVIDRIHGMYPNKKFLAVGDSTQKDPETYAEALRKFGDRFMTCIWIRRVEGADNSPERFARAFQGVSNSKVRIFTDADIPSLHKINVARGEC